MVVELIAAQVCCRALQVVYVELDVKLRFQVARLDGYELPPKLEHGPAVEWLSESCLAVNYCVFEFVNDAGLCCRCAH